MKFRFIESELGNFPVRTLCKVLSVSKSGFYKWLSFGKSHEIDTSEDLMSRIVDLHVTSRRTYGRRRIFSSLRHQGVSVSRGRVARLMKKLGLRGEGQPVKIRTTVSGTIGAVPNLILGECVQIKQPNEVWYSDISYVKTGEGWLYLCVVIDAFSRAIVGWSMSTRLKTKLLIDAVKPALQNRSVVPGLIFHSDKGSQYRSHAFSKLLQAWGVRQSMTGVDHCYENAFAESFFATLKKELVYRTVFSTRETARSAIFEFIEVFYNRRRIHSSLGNLPPLVYEVRQT